MMEKVTKTVVGTVSEYGVSDLKGKGVKFSVVSRRQFTKQNGELAESKIYTKVLRWSNGYGEELMNELLSLKAGDRIYLEGECQSSSNKDKDGNQTWEEVVRPTYLLKLQTEEEDKIPADVASSLEEDDKPWEKIASAAADAMAEEDDFEEIGDDEDPFAALMNPAPKKESSPAPAEAEDEDYDEDDDGWY